ncbi:nicotinate phosphoribosyltransferase [Priestia aryabhattai]|uniref:nicotinate phosphoribosyltransferase n=1 Tax=Priestia aryabhattai TaxID=412384 RepID=UPI0039A1F64B
MKKFNIAMLLCDFYKVGHKPQYPVGTEVIYSTWIPRSNKYYPRADKVVTFYIQGFMKELIEFFNENFFNRPKADIIAEYKRLLTHTLGKEPDTEHIEELHDLGYLPIKVMALPEGTLAPIKTPMMTIENTDKRFFWITNYLETLISNMIWQPMTSATIAYTYRKLLDEYAMKTVGNTDGVAFQGHDFSMRGMGGFDASMSSGAGHLLSFTGTDTIPAISYLEKYYNADVTKELVGASIPATEHSVMSANTDAESRDEYETFKRLITEVYPDGFVSIVSDTYDFWKVVGEVLPKLKETILARDGKVVIRPDSGDPVEIICGKDYDANDLREIESKDIDELLIEEDGIFHERINKKDNKKLYTELRDITWDLWRDSTKGDRDEGDSNFEFMVKSTDGKLYKVEADILNYEYYETTTMGEVSFWVEKMNTLEAKGLIEALWDLFGGTITDKGYKLLDSHIGAIYGDSITIDRAEAIVKGLEAKGFASTNIVLGIGSYTYQCNTRDTLGFAMKATYMIKNGEEHMLFKDPKTDDGTKRSLRGKVHVSQTVDGIKFVDGLTSKVHVKGINLLQTVFKDGKLLRDESLSEIRARLAQG